MTETTPEERAALVEHARMHKDFDWDKQHDLFLKSGDALMALLDQMGMDGDWRARHDFAGIMGMVWPLLELTKRGQKQAVRMAELIESDGKRLALADDAPHAMHCRWHTWNTSPNREALPEPGCTCWKAKYASAKKAM